MVAEPVTTLAPALPRPHVLRQRWCDVAFLHWAVRPDAVARFFPPGVRPLRFRTDGDTSPPRSGRPSSRPLRGADPPPVDSSAGSDAGRRRPSVGSPE